MAKQRSNERKTTAKADATQGLPPLNLHAAGIDVGNAEHYMAVPPVCNRPGIDPEFGAEDIFMLSVGTGEPEYYALAHRMMLSSSGCAPTTATRAATRL
jgi:hypothetical protein